MALPGVPVKVGNHKDCVVYFDFSRARKRHRDLELFDNYSVKRKDPRPWPLDCSTDDEYGWEAGWNRQ